MYVMPRSSTAAAATAARCSTQLVFMQQPTVSTEKALAWQQKSAHLAAALLQHAQSVVCIAVCVATR